jgi:predicted  nucleic acid-binding Zn-ribbon protein
MALNEIHYESTIKKLQNKIDKLNRYLLSADITHNELDTKYINEKNKCDELLAKINKYEKNINDLHLDIDFIQKQGDLPTHTPEPLTPSSERELTFPLTPSSSINNGGRPRALLVPEGGGVPCDIYPITMVETSHANDKLFKELEYQKTLNNDLLKEIDKRDTLLKQLDQDNYELQKELIKSQRAFNSLPQNDFKFYKSLDDELEDIEEYSLCCNSRTCNII